MAEPEGIKLSTPFGPLAATGASAILAVLVLAVGIYVYREMDKIQAEFVGIRQHIDARYKDINDGQNYNACLNRLSLWRSTQPRDQPINFDALPAEFLYCLPRFLVEKR